MCVVLRDVQSLRMFQLQDLEGWEPDRAPRKATPVDEVTDLATSNEEVEEGEEVEGEEDSSDEDLVSSNTNDEVRMH